MLNNLKKDNLILKVIIVIFCIILAIIIIILTIKAPKPSTGLIVIENKDQDRKNGSVIISNNERDKEYCINYIRNDSEQNWGCISKLAIPNTTSGCLYSAAKQGNKTGSSCFEMNKPKNEDKRLIDISFDISGSINWLSGELADFDYNIFSRVKDILKSEAVRPGDHIRIRFFGENKEALRENKFDFIYFKPDLTINYHLNIFQRSKNTAFITVDNISFTEITNKNTEILNQEEVFSKIKKIYNKTKVEKNIGDRTSLIKHFNNIIADNKLEVKNKTFDSVIYIIQTDGVHQDRMTQKNGSLNVSEDGTKDSVYFIGLNERKNIEIKEEMKNIFKPITDITFLDSFNN